MKKCLLCEKEIELVFSWAWLLSFEPLKIPIVCKDCQQKFVSIKKEARCLGCGRQMAKKGLCLDCKKWQQTKVLLHNYAFYNYHEPFMRAYFERYKFLGDRRLSKVFSAELTTYCRKFQKRGWLIVLIPVDQDTLQKRGFDQVESFFPKLKTNDYLYQKQKLRLKHQVAKGRSERLKGAQPFGYCGPKDLNKQNVLLVDDIYTTGSTLYHAADLLLAHNCGRIKSVTLAR